MEGDMVKAPPVAPSVSVLMAIYDPPLEMLEMAVESILAQSFREFEFLILCDGSQPEAVRLYLQLTASIDRRVRVFEEPHRGLTPTLNRGLRLAGGEFIARQDADDWSAPERLSRQVEFLRQHRNVALVGTEAQLHGADGKKLWRMRLPGTASEVSGSFPQGNPFVHGSTMFRREVALRIGGYREEFTCSQDYDFFWRLMEEGGAVNLNEALYHYRYTGGAISARRSVDQARHERAARILAGWRQRGEGEDVGAAIEAADREAGGDPFRAGLKQADHLMLAGDFGGARKAYWRLLRARPASGLAWAKLLRLGIFSALPWAREVSFR
jgi:glycosyltransferase involved in cell wall biosynthesis